MSNIINIKNHRDAKAMIKLSNLTPNEYYQNNFNYSEYEILKMREELAEQCYENMPTDEVYEIAYKQVYGDYATMSVNDLIKQWESKK